MKRTPFWLAIPLVAVVILAVALIDAFTIVTRPLQPFFDWMLP